jgi:hypothetical protein
MPRFLQRITARTAPMALKSLKLIGIGMAG